MSDLLEIGKTCSHPACSLVDFLPIKCQYCSQPFCSDHYKPQVHSCAKFDPSKHDRIAPECPFCHKPVAFGVGVDPNIAMEEHFERKCEVVRGGGLVGLKTKAPTSTGEPRCARAKCNKVLVAPIRCNECNQQFCAEHRWPTNHKCKNALASSSSTPSSSTTPIRSSSPAVAPTVSESISARRNAALAAMNRAAASTKATLGTRFPSTPVKAASSSTAAMPSASASTSASASMDKKPSNSTPKSNPFSKTERRSRAEEESRRKALRERAKKGLLTEAEKAKLAEEAAEGGQKGDCIVM